MKLSRDSAILWVGLVTGIVGVFAANLDLFPDEWKGYITVASSVLAAVSGWLKTSPLPGQYDVTR